MLDDTRANELAALFLTRRESAALMFANGLVATHIGQLTNAAWIHTVDIGERTGAVTSLVSYINCYYCGYQGEHIAYRTDANRAPCRECN